MSTSQPYIGGPVTRIRCRNGIPGLDAAPVVEHVESLLSIGMTKYMITRASGISYGPINAILAGQPTLTREAHDALMSVTPRPHRQQAMVMAYGIHRRIAALALQGWSVRSIATEGGMHPRTLERALRSNWARWTTHVAVDAVYEKLSHLDGGNQQIKASTRARDAVHPMMWDDIDDYFEVPITPVDTKAIDEIVVRRLVNGQVVATASRSERQEAVRILTDRGLSAEHIAANLRVSEKTVERDRKAIAC